MNEIDYNKFTIYVPCPKDTEYFKIFELLKSENIEYNWFDGTNCSSFSKLINLCILDCKTENIIIINDKARPTYNNIIKMINLINDGYGFVGMYRFGFFGFNLDLIRRIGWFDERYIGQGYQDDDFIVRLRESNISVYLSEEIEYLIRTPSRWGDESKAIINKNIFNNKFSKNFNRNLEEDTYYDIGVDTGHYMKPWKDSYYNCPNCNNWGIQYFL